MPHNGILVLRPSYSPELNPVERLWLYLRGQHLPDDYDAVNACCHACNQLTPERISNLCGCPRIQQIKL